MKKNTGKEYEEFVQSIQQILINNDQMPNISNINVEINKKIKDRNGIERQFDIYWEFKLSGYTYQTVIECKDYQTPISIDKIDELIGKINDIPGLRPIYATKTGYQSGAEEKAKSHKIDLLIIKKPEDWDWKSIDGEPFVKKMVIQISHEYSPKISSFRPHADELWLKNNPDINSFSNIKIKNDEVYILDEDNKTKISVSELADTLPLKIKNMQYGTGSYSEILTNSYLQFDGSDVKIKISKFELDYIYNKPIKNDTVIDLCEQLLGIVHNYTSKEQKLVYKNGRVTSM